MRSENLMDRPPVERGDPPEGMKWRGYGTRGWDAWQVDGALHPPVYEDEYVDTLPASVTSVIPTRQASRRILLGGPTRYIAHLFDLPFTAPTSAPLNISKHPFASVLVAGYAQQMPLPLWLLVIGALPLNRLFAKTILDYEGIALCQPPYAEILCGIQAEMYRRDGRSSVCPPLTRATVGRFARDPLTREFFGSVDEERLAHRMHLSALIGTHPDRSELELGFMLDAELARQFLFSNATQLHPNIFARLVRAFGLEAQF